MIAKRTLLLGVLLVAAGMTLEVAEADAQRRNRTRSRPPTTTAERANRLDRPLTVTRWSPREEAHPGTTLVIYGVDFDPKSVDVRLGRGSRAVKLPVTGGSSNRIEVRITSDHYTSGAPLSIGQFGKRRRVLDSNYRVLDPEPAGSDIGTRSPFNIQFCFGALGAGCGGAQSGIALTALCGGGNCKINAGSWEHDECCWRSPNGMACRNGPADYVTGHDGSCVAAWNKALSRLNAGFNWSREVDYSRANSQGRVRHRFYCARAGAVVHRDDAQYCCSRRADPASAANLAAGDRLPGWIAAAARPEARICR